MVGIETTDKQYREYSILLNECVIAGVQNIKHVNKLIIWSMDVKYLKI